MTYAPPNVCEHGILRGACVICDAYPKAHPVTLEQVKEEFAAKYPPRANQVQAGGDHYKTMAIQPWDVYDTWPTEQRVGAYRANCVKYVMRLDTKDSRLLNAKKLAHYAQKLVEVLQELEE